MHKTEPRHVKAMRDILAYAKSTMPLRLVYKKKGSAIEALFDMTSKQDAALFSVATTDKMNTNPFIAYADANHANASDEQRKSISGYCMFFMFCLVCWKSKLQSLTAQSTHEAELIAIAAAANEAMWLRFLLLEIGFTLVPCSTVRVKASPTYVDAPEIGSIAEATDVYETPTGDDDGLSYTMPPVPVLNDNEGTIKTCGQPETKQNSKWIEIRYFRIRQLVKRMMLVPLHIRTKFNVADFFTKPFPIFKDFIRLRTYCGMVEFDDL